MSTTKTKLKTIMVEFENGCVEDIDVQKNNFKDTEVGYCTYVLKQCIAAGHKIILSTKYEDKILENIIDWFKIRDIPLYGVNENPENKSKTGIFGDYYISSKALGCPIIGYININNRCFVDWYRISTILKENGIIKENIQDVEHRTMHDICTTRSASSEGDEIELDEEIEDPDEVNTPVRPRMVPMQHRDAVPRFYSGPTIFPEIATPYVGVTQSEEAAATARQ